MLRTTHPLSNFETMPAGVQRSGSLGDDHWQIIMQLARLFCTVACVMKT